jgi:hypothetical protein
MTERQAPRPDPDRPPDEGAYDPQMDEGDEGNTPDQSDGNGDEEPVERPL